MEPQFFQSAADFRDWLGRHHEAAAELWVGFYNRQSAKGGLTYQDAVDAALCHGWIDGLKRRADHA